MMRKYILQDGRLEERNGDTGPQVLVCLNPDEQEKRFLVEAFDLDEHTLNSALDPNELSRIELEPDHTAIIFKVPRNYSATDEFEFKVSSIGLFLRKNHLLLVSSEEIGPFTGKSFSRMSSLSEVMLRILSQYVAHYLSHLQVMDRVSEEIADKINTSMDNKYVLHLFALEKSLVYYSNAMTSNSVLMERLKNFSIRMGFSEDEREQLDDIIIENQQAFKQAQVYANILSRMMDSRISIVNNNLNIMMRRLTVVTIAIMVPTLVVSAFSMNVAIPLAKHEFAFWIILFLAIFSMVGTLLLWRGKR